MYSSRHKNKTVIVKDTHYMKKAHRVKWAGLRMHTYTVLNVATLKKQHNTQKIHTNNNKLFYLNKSFILSLKSTKCKSTMVRATTINYNSNITD